MTMNLTEELRKAIAAQPGRPVHLVDPQTHTDYVLLRADIFDQMQASYDDSDYDVREMLPHMAKVFGPAGWDDPEMDVYDDIVRSALIQ